MLSSIEFKIPAPTRTREDAQSMRPLSFHPLAESWELLHLSQILLSTTLTLERRPAAQSDPATSQRRRQRQRPEGCVVLGPRGKQLHVVVRSPLPRRTEEVGLCNVGFYSIA